MSKGDKIQISDHRRRRRKHVAYPWEVETGGETQLKGYKCV